MKMFEVDFQPVGKKIQVRSGTTLLDAGRRAGVPIRTRCGGRAACLMCKVTLERNHPGVTPPTLNERRKLGSDLERGMRLACQTRVAGDLTVTVPEDPLKAAIRKQLARQQEEDHWL